MSALVCAGLLLPATAGLAADNEGQITISGADGALHDNLLAAVGLSEDCSASLLRLQRQVPALRRRLVRALNALGYYHARLDTEFGNGENCWHLTIDVEPNEPVRLRNVDMRIAGTDRDRALFMPVLEDSPLDPDSVLHHGDYESFKNALTSRAAEFGYFDAVFDEALIALDLPAKAADITLHFNPGERYRFGELQISRPGRLSQKIIDGMIPIKPGDFYDASRLSDVRQSLDRSTFFNQISVVPNIDRAEDRQVPIQIDLSLRPQHKWTGGVGFTTDTGPRARVEYQNRLVNSRGHRWNADIALSSVRGQVNGSYSIPLNRRYADDLILTAAFIQEDNDTYLSKRFQTGISLPSENPWGWTQNLTLDYQRDDYELASRVDVSSLVIPGISLSKTRADNLINPSRGWKLLGTLKGASDTLLSDTSFVQWYSSAKLIRSFGRFRMLTRMELGATWIEEAQDLPASLRFYAGGDQSVRGYDFRSLGPREEQTGDVEGGKQLLTGSLEFDYRVRPNWRVAVFADTGNAFNSRTGYELNSSAGIGLRWMSPIGPLRVDLAHPFDSDESFRLHVTMGPDL